MDKPTQLSRQKQKSNDSQAPGMLRGRDFVYEERQIINDLNKLLYRKVLTEFLKKIPHFFSGHMKKKSLY